MCPGTEQDMNPLLRPFVRLVHGLARIFGEDFEIMLHDTSQFESSIVALANGRLTGRTVGSPMNGYGLELINSGVFEKSDTHSYLARTNDGALIRCGVICLRDEQGKIIGLLCIHMDTAKLRTAKDLLDRLFSMGDESTREEPINEFFGLEIDDVFRNSINEIKLSVKKPLKSLSKREKKEVVKNLQEKGFFMMKGAVEYIAGEMGNSKFTVYAYMREIGKESTKEMKKVKDRHQRITRGGSNSRNDER